MHVSISHALKLRSQKTMRLLIGLMPLVALMLLLVPTVASAQSSVRPPDTAVSIDGIPLVDGAVPGDALGNRSDAEMWRTIRQGGAGDVVNQDGNAAVLVQSAGENWRLLRDGPLFDYLGLAMIGTLVALSVFFALRGRIRVREGMSGIRIKRFSLIERSGHWLMAMSFIVLAISGLNVSFGRSLVLPLLGKDLFGPVSGFLKLAHNYVAFAFLLGLAMAFVMWVIHNIPNRHDIVWLAKGGGIIGNAHPPAKKFNAGQKIIFWLVMIGGLSLGVSGWALLFPFEHAFFSDTVALLGKIGIDLPSLVGMAEPPYSAIQEQQYNSIWHALVAVFMICLIFAHIYIGSVGMEGAFDAMGEGEVDLNWAREHHSLWVDELEMKDGKPAYDVKVQPAE
jgi:formate dehydrogenase subunit gamma